MKLQEAAIETTEFPIINLMQNYVDYNLWANATLVNWLRTKPEDLLEQQVPSSFRSIKLTMVHVWHTQHYWLSVIKGSDTETFESFNGSLEDTFTGLVEHSLTFADYINSMSNNDIEESTMVISPWFQSDFPNFEYIMQCMNHSTYHRGQIITIAHNLGPMRP
jgi:uncharacterized damage-inducible protein DinB